MDSPDGKQSYLAKPVAAESVKLLREHFPSILKNFGEQTSRLTAHLTVCLHVWQWLLCSVEIEEKADLHLNFKMNTAWISICFVLFERAKRP